MEGDWILFDLCTCNMPYPCEFAQAHMTVMVYLQLPVLPWPFHENLTKFPIEDPLRQVV